MKSVLNKIKNNPWKIGLLIVGLDALFFNEVLFYILYISCTILTIIFVFKDIVNGFFEFIFDLIERI